MSSLINKVKEKLHVGKDKDTVATSSAPSSVSSQSTTGPTTATATAGHTGATTGHTGATTGHTGATPGHTGATKGHTGATTGHTGASTGTTGAQTRAGGVPVTSQRAGATTGTSAAAGTGAASGTTTATGTGASSGRAMQPGNVSVAGQSGAPSETVVVHEHDPNWSRARDLTTGAEQASKLSAAKAYEAESHLVSAQDAHQLAQDATTRHAHLAAQAEAEKRNIGSADYIHKELDSFKNKVEEKEKIHVDMNKNLDSARQLVSAKEGELGSVAPVVQQHQKEIDGLSNKLSSLQGAKGDLEGKHNQYAASLEKLRGQHGQYANEVARLEREVEQLNLHANELEEQAKAARLTAQERLKNLQAAKSALSDLSVQSDKASKGLSNVEKDLAGYKNREAELSQRLTAAQAAAKDAADLAAAKQAELQLARQQLDAEQAKGQPVAQDIDRYRREIHEKEREYEEAMTSSKAAREAYERFSAQAAQAAKEASAAELNRNQKYDTYQQLRDEAQAAKDRELSLWEEAKKHGNTGDVNALQRLAEAEKRLTPSEGAINQPIVAPSVGPKEPTTEGPKIHRSERASEKNENVSKEDVKTHY